MKSDNIMTLFSEEPRPRTGPSAILVSIFVHCIFFAALWAGLQRAPRVGSLSHLPRYAVRFLKQPLVEEQPPQRVRDGKRLPAKQTEQRNIATAGGSTPAKPTFVPQLPQRSQTLVQPDAPPDLTLQQEVSVPLAVLWSAENSPSRTITAPPRQAPTIVQTRPALIKPNREPNLADVNITSTPFPTKLPMLPPGSTSPIVVHGVAPVEQIPSTSSAQVESATPAQVLSLSPIQAHGPVAIPAANQSAKSDSGQLSLSQSQNKSSGNGGGNPGSHQSGVGAGDGAGVASGQGKAGSGQVARNGGGGGVAESGSTLGNGNGLAPPITHIALPRDGQFGVVVVGSSAVSDEYPEIEGIWSGRLVYTVYLHVGLSKNWILQYSLPRADEALAGGTISRPEAPWPYDIQRPNLSQDDTNSDAIMVHGFINLAGEFERLALVYPSGFAHAKFVLSALQQWHFRPARQNGQLTAVEVLLIIPEETE
jgi:hypothetical protein